MKMKQSIGLIALLLSTALGLGQDTTFTYQGRVIENTNLANGAYDFQFLLLDNETNGTSVGTNQLAPVAVSGGLFTVVLDFGGGIFNGAQRWLLIGVRTNGSPNPYFYLYPPQPITAQPYAIQAANGVPPGSIMAYMGTNAPGGWLLCDGSAVSRTQYSRLFAVVGVSSGSGDGVTTFNLPDLRGMFLRGLDGTAGVDPDKATRTAAKPGGNVGNEVGSSQPDQLKSHTHANGSFNRALQVSNGTSTTTTATDVTPAEPDILNSAPMASVGGNENRPKNIYVNYLIKQ
jgi:microcystin-dependent protein